MRSYDMKNLKLLFLFLPLLAGCHKSDAVFIKTDRDFDMSYRDKFVIPVGLSTFEAHIFTFKNIAVDTAVFFQANKLDSVGKITQIIPRSMNVRLVFNGDGNLNFVRRVEVSVFDAQISAGSEQVIFYNDDVQLSNSGQINLIPLNSDVRKLFISGNGRYVLRIKFNLREITQRSYDVEWNTVFLAKT
jgi:hypothetical protein